MKRHAVRCWLGKHQWSDTELVPIGHPEWEPGHAFYVECTKRCLRCGREVRWEERFR